MPPKKVTPPALSFDSALSHEPADKRIEILRLVGESGSISQAAREGGVSYKAAWQAIDTLTNLAGVTLVERAVGGSGGGGAQITPAGAQLLAVAKKLADSRAGVLAAAASTAQSSPTSPALPYIGVRTSMRNQLPCTVDKLEIKGQLARVYLRLDGGAGHVLVSSITKASAELLGLRTGQSVLALCKATAVTVRAAGVRTRAGQHLNGSATRISRGATGDEVSLQLCAGLRLVGLAKAGSGIRSKAAVVAAIDESALVIALAG
ncbi:MAG: TOBE domain-containing protein [Pseudomonadota bacterium]